MELGEGDEEEVRTQRNPFRRGPRAARALAVAQPAKEQRAQRDI